VGRIARLIKTEIEKFIVQTVEMYFGANVTAETFAPSGDDSPPLPDDRIVLVQTDGTNNFVAVGVLSVSQGAKPGEKILYSRNNDGEVMAALKLLNDGSIQMQTFGDAGINLTDKAGKTVLAAASYYMDMLVYKAGNKALAGCVDNGKIVIVPAEIDVVSHFDYFAVADQNVLLTEVFRCKHVRVFNKYKHFVPLYRRYFSDIIAPKQKGWHIFIKKEYALLIFMCVCFNSVFGQKLKETISVSFGTHNGAEMHRDCAFRRRYRFGKRRGFLRIAGVFAAYGDKCDVALYSPGLRSIVRISGEIEALSVKGHNVTEPVVLFRMEELSGVIGPDCLEIDTQNTSAYLWSKMHAGVPFNVRNAFRQDDNRVAFLEFRVWPANYRL